MAAAQAAPAATWRWQSGVRRDLPGARPLILYFDGSAFAKLFLREPGSEHVQALWAVDRPRVTSAVAYVEVRSALAAAERSRRISLRRRNAVLGELDEAWSIMTTVDVDGLLALFAGAMTATHGLRALDAIHLASALVAQHPETVMVSWDDELRRAAEAEGLALSPA